MSLIKRQPSAAQSSASRANSLLSTGPRTARGKDLSRRNGRARRTFCEVVVRSMEAIGESGRDFDQRHEALSQAMGVRDAWEAAWVEDIAVLRWRIARLRRAEVATLALRRRRLQTERRRKATGPTGSAGLELNNWIGMVGFTGIPDSAMKFQQVTKFLAQLRSAVSARTFDQDATLYLTLLYGKTPGPQGTLLKARIDTLLKSQNEFPEAAEEGRELLIADIDKEIENYEQLQALYAAEHLEADGVQRDSELLLPGEELAAIIRYETHLEDQIERKLRQFYARRRESVLAPADGGSIRRRFAQPPAPESSSQPRTS